MYLISKRIFDLIASFTALILLFPLLIIISLLIIVDGKGGVFYKQIRVGKNQREFKLFKFRSMRPNSDKTSQITIGNDTRITRIGRFIRRFKLDEIPQLINIFFGDMSIVGPRPEVPKYVSLYTEEQLRVLKVLPGLTDYASIEYMDEQSLLGASVDPEKTYVEEVMPAKLKLNLKYIDDRNFLLDTKLIFKTIFKIFRRMKNHLKICSFRSKNPKQ